MYDEYRREEFSEPPVSGNPFGCTLNPPPDDSHHPMHRPDHYSGPSPFEHPGPCHPVGPDIYHPGVPNPVMTEYHHQHPPIPPRPMEEMFVTKKQLNEVLRHLAEADIFTDTTTDGTTCSVGGIVKGTKFVNKLTFVEFIEKLLYPTDATEGAYITQAELEDALESIDYNDLINKPNSFDFEYPCKDEDGLKILNYIVKTPAGGFTSGDSLENMTICEIIEKLLCGGPDLWGKYIWKSDMYDLPSGTLEIPATNFPGLATDIAADTAGLEHWLLTSLSAGKYELYAVVPTVDKADTTLYKYNCLIACSNTSEQTTPQVTNPTWEDVPSTLSWTYNTETGKVVLSGSGITTNMTIIMVARSI